METIKFKYKMKDNSILIETETPIFKMTAIEIEKLSIEIQKIMTVHPKSKRQML